MTVTAGNIGGWTVMPSWLYNGSGTTCVTLLGPS